MKILFLTPFGYDYLPDQLYTGLCNVLGVDSVIDFPWKREYHDPSYKNSLIPQNSARQYELEEVCTLLDERKIDLIVLTAQRRGTVESLDYFSKKFSLPALVFVDSSDTVDVRVDLFQKFRPGLYFKRELLSGADAGLQRGWKIWKRLGVYEELFRRIYPLQMSAILETIPTFPDSSRPIDISFNGFVSNRKRIKAVNLLRALENIRFEGGVYADLRTRKSKLAQGLGGTLLAKLQGDPFVSEKDCLNKLTYDEHFHLLRRSKIGLSIRGSGFDTVRYWEIVASKTLMISERPSIYIPNNFEHEKHAVFCRPDLRDLVDLVKKYTRDHRAREHIAEAGYNHLLKYHTCGKRAEQFLEVCKQKL